MKSYAEALAYLYSFANYELSAMSPRTDMRLTRMRRLLELAGNPHERFRSVHIAGTKGKGSTAAMIASIAQAAGLRAGLYSTPHLNTHRERMRIDGQLISRDEFVDRVQRVRRIVDEYDAAFGHPTTYELGTLLTFQYFADHEVDLAVVEVGLGGRLDATNVIQPDVAVFASISYDHTDVLGPTLTDIAREKAGIIKPGVPAISEPQQPEAAIVLERRARELGVPLTFVPPLRLIGAHRLIEAGLMPTEIEQCFELPARPLAAPTVNAEGAGLTQRVRALGRNDPIGAESTEIRIDTGSGAVVCMRLLGSHQLSNAGVAVAVARQLGWPEQAIVRGLEEVRWPGRLEILRERPLVVADGAHNVDSMEKLAAAIRERFRYERLRVIAGFSADKDIPGMAAVLDELANEVVLTRSKHPRSAAPEAITGHFGNVRIARDLGEALAGQGERELALITGSLYLVGEARLHLGRVAPEDQDPF
ncbi:MAG TPA: folylpolyglutamate synthase/dihydrofolate synthase family protein [Chloroflexota bacterium]|nr:folylpolyglutamate synthase/dihydrofolate synthase family protein [Chloroflexota bacterium]